MPLLAVPFKPNTYEWHFLAKERVLADQMEYRPSNSEQSATGRTDWLQAFGATPGSDRPLLTLRRTTIRVGLYGPLRYISHCIALSIKRTS